MVKIINKRLSEIETKILQLVENQKISLTEKNIQMEPLVKESKILKNTVNELEELLKRNFIGQCKLK